MKRSWNTFVVLTGREVEGIFLTPLGYIVLTVSLVLTGYTFFTSLQQAQGNVAFAVSIFLGNSFLFWLVLLFVPPLISMRLFAEERRSGTIEMLMTAPVTEASVVLAKFFGGLIFFGALWVPTLFYVAIVKTYGAIPDPGALLTAYLGILLVGSFLLSVGCLTSVLATNQISAALTSVVFNLLFVFAPFISSIVVWRGVREFLEAIWPIKHFEVSFSQGVLDTAHVAYYLILTALMLFISIRVLESRKWK